MKTEKIQQIKVSELQPFANHPFKVRQDNEMVQMTESIREYGVIIPVLVRPLENSKYELISGHRRMAACKELGIDAIPSIVREMTNEESIITMVDSNLQRENVLPSEKAFAYKMKLEAIKHQGKSTSRQVVGKLESADVISKDESGRQIQRYIRLTELIPELLQMVDECKVAFNPAVEISYLSTDEQKLLLEIMQIEDRTPSHAQAIRFKKLSQDGVLDNKQISEIMRETKPNQQEQYKFKREDIRKYFPKSYSDQQIYDAVFKALELLKKQRERSKDAR